MSRFCSKVTHTACANFSGAFPLTRGASHLNALGGWGWTTTVVKGEPAMGSPSRLTETSYLPRLASVCVIVYDPSPLSWHAAGTCSAAASVTDCLQLGPGGSGPSIWTSKNSPPLRERLP